jgi:hypothetical protein
MVIAAEAWRLRRLAVAPFNEENDDDPGQDQPPVRKESFVRDPRAIAQPVKQVHRRVAELVLLEFPDGLLFILCHLDSSCKPA